MDLNIVIYSIAPFLKYRKNTAMRIALNFAVFCFLLCFLALCTAPWYNKLLLYQVPATGGGAYTLNFGTSFLCSILASVAAHYICKWLDEQR